MMSASVGRTMSTSFSLKTRKSPTFNYTCNNSLRNFTPRTSKSMLYNAH